MKELLPGWVGILISLIIASVTMVGWVHSNFATIREVDNIHKTLEKMDNKLDRLIEKAS